MAIWMHSKSSMTSILFLIYVYFHNIQNLKGSYNYLGQDSLRKQSIFYLTFRILRYLYSMSIRMIEGSTHWRFVLRAVVISICWNWVLWRILPRSWSILCIIHSHCVICKSFRMGWIESCAFRWNVFRIEVGSFFVYCSLRVILSWTGLVSWLLDSDTLYAFY
jgi:hypothetical protein